MTRTRHDAVCALFIGAILAAIVLAIPAVSVAQNTATSTKMQDNGKRLRMQFQSLEQLRMRSAISNDRNAAHRAATKEYLDALKKWNDSSKTRASREELAQARMTYQNTLKEIRSDYTKAKLDWHSALGSWQGSGNASSTNMLRLRQDEFQKKRAGRFAQKCHNLTSTSTTQGFGSAADVTTGNRELMIKAFCDPNSTDATVEVGNGRSQQYIYRFGYRLDPTTKKWKRFEFDTVLGEKLGEWISGSAFADLELDAELAEDPAQIAAYVCVWDGGRWKCGCQNSACDKPLWQLQIVKPLKDRSGDGEQGVSTNGSDGANGTDGVNGTDGANGEDGSNASSY